MQRQRWHGDEHRAAGGAGQTREHEHAVTATTVATSTACTAWPSPKARNPWNERGLYTGIEIRPNRKWTINAYFDQFRFPWLRYQTDAPSARLRLVGTGELAARAVAWRSTSVRATRTVHATPTEDIDGIDPLVRVAQTNYRVNATYKVSDAVSLRTRVETVDFQRGSSPLEHGFLIYQDIVHRPLSSPLELTLRFALFETDSYNARLYAYENDLIGVFSIPPYYGRGMRWYAMARLTPLRARGRVGALRRLHLPGPGRRSAAACRRSRQHAQRPEVCRCAGSSDGTAEG